MNVALGKSVKVDLRAERKHEKHIIIGPQFTLQSIYGICHLRCQSCFTKVETSTESGKMVYPIVWVL